jgi:hypothetical protein
MIPQPVPPPPPQPVPPPFVNSGYNPASFYVPPPMIPGESSLPISTAYPEVPNTQVYDFSNNSYPVETYTMMPPPLMGMNPEFPGVSLNFIL